MKRPTAMRLSLQYFAENEETPADLAPPAEGKPNYEELLETDNDLKTLLNGKVQTAVQAELEKQRVLSDEKSTEAQKLAKMNSDEKRAYELKKAQEEIVRYQTLESVRALKEEALKTASEKAIPSSLVDLIPFAHIKAEEVNTHLEGLKTAFDTAVSQGIAIALDGAGTPKSMGDKAQGTSKETFAKMSYLERVKFKQTDPKAYANFTTK